MRLVPLLTFLLSIASFTLSLCNGNLNVPCPENERQTLLMFKKDLNDSSNLLSSWVAEGDCCTWTGVACDNLTGHVRELHLAAYYDEVAGEYHRLGGKVNPSLLNLKHLTYLDLSYNDFGGRQFPSFLGSLKGLRYLNLSDARFDGTVPHQLGNLSSLRYLDLSGNYGSKVENLKWLSGLSQLKHLGMSWVDLTGASHWLQVNTLPSLLVELHLSGCELSHIPSGIANLTSLKVLDLSSNYFNSTIPQVNTLPSLLVELHLSFCELYHMPSGIANLTSLKVLDLSWNQFNSTIPQLSDNNFSGHLSDQLGIFKNLHRLDLSNNSISGLIPVSLGNLSRLEELIISNNLFEGVVSEAHFTNLTRLDTFYANENSLTLKTSPDWVPPFQLSLLSLSSWRLDPSQLPAWLQSQKHLLALNMSSTGISGTIPAWLWNISSVESQEMGYASIFVDLSRNQLSGEREGHFLEDGGFYMSLGLGFAFGFWIVLGSLLSNVPWSNAFSQFQNRIVKKFYAAIVERY
ncbi:hypothetical protein DVH24_016389 [Malus domestica]|uniref:Uncharacterized protein n=1 Tax=Malus domestica TaxID=3750 RepID=A0A498HVN4_MALDO|nr:hypothetical protein DVH24_016389 [Malus domestica]